MCANPMIEKHRAVFREKNSGRKRILSTVSLSSPPRLSCWLPFLRRSSLLPPGTPQLPGDHSRHSADALLDLSCPKWSVSLPGPRAAESGRSLEIHILLPILEASLWASGAGGGGGMGQQSPALGG